MTIGWIMLVLADAESKLSIPHWANIEVSLK